MQPQEILDRVKSRFGDAVLDAKMDALQPFVVVAAGSIDEICRFLRDEADLRFNYLMCLSGVDTNDGKLGVVYHCSSMEFKHMVVLKVFVPKDAPVVKSVSRVWGTAEWHEREALDLYGFTFEGHPDPRRILCPDDWEGYPLRKDYKVQEFYNGMKVPY